MRPSAAVAAIFALTLLVPFSLRALDARFGDHSIRPSYLPALEGPRAREPFDPYHRDAMADRQPGLVVIGDSMAGTRIDKHFLAQLSGERVHDILQAGSGPVYWYLALKNWVIASGARPRFVFIFFRDTNLTDVMFRLEESSRWNVDKVAHDAEPEVNAVVASRAGPVRQLAKRRVESTYGADRARLWMGPLLGDRIARLIEPSRRRRQVFVDEMNGRLDFTHMRPIETADVEDAIDSEADFDYYVGRSVLPLMLRDAKRAGLTLFFVRAQRRPSGGRPPAQSEALRTYIEELRRYVTSQGAMWRDDTGDPLMTLDLYGDGDHIAREMRQRYTAIFWNRVGPLIH
jgi:hypothetical protein